jgi:hypothetical protein
MVRRAVLVLFAVALAALASLQGAPGPNAAESNLSQSQLAAAGSTSSGAGVLSAPMVRGGLTEDTPDIAVIQGADADDNTSALAVRFAVMVLWPQAAFERRILEAGDRAGPNYWPCVAVPRAPPAV